MGGSKLETFNICVILLLVLGGLVHALFTGGAALVGSIDCGAKGGLFHKTATGGYACKLVRE